MSTIRRAVELHAEGLSNPEIARLVRHGELDRVRRNAYADPPPEELSTAAAHRRLIQATAPQLEPGAVVSHASAAVLHGLPVWRGDLEHVHVTRNRSTGAQRRSVVRVHGATLTGPEVVEVDGIPVTSMARTVLDMARRLPVEHSVAAGDAALADGLSLEDLDRGLAGMLHWPGVRRARRVVGVLDAKSESPGESVSRLRMLRDGVPVPQLQYEVCNGDGVLVGRCDFAWPELRTLGEFDGRVKYGRLLQPGQHIEDVIFAEKQREDALRDLGYQVVRWLWEDAFRPGVIRDRLYRAFRRSTGGLWIPAPHFTSFR